jgi:hypothetical protein
MAQTVRLKMALKKVCMHNKSQVYKKRFSPF